jgi:hypothetical protein
MTNLWSSNTPAQFWQCVPTLPEDQWLEAITKALPILNLSVAANDLDCLLETILGEGQFGANHWQLSKAKRLYYSLKPLLPRPLIRAMRRFYGRHTEGDFALGWPIESRYAAFQWEVMRQLLILRREQTFRFRSFWPDNAPFALVLTHDIETANGQDYVRVIADLEESLGFRSSFSFVPERYALDYSLIQELQERGFEIVVHGLKHDGKEFSSYREFSRRAPRINDYLSALGAVGFAAPLTIRQPEWMQMLKIEYDRSFFDTDPYEAIAGGVMTIWPYSIGHFIELPYTLEQDYTLTTICGERTPRLWLDKTDFIQKYHGMALVITHPDYLKTPSVQQIYGDFLQTIKEKYTYWHTLSRDAARWWRIRISADPSDAVTFADVSLQGDRLKICPAPSSTSTLHAFASIDEQHGKSPTVDYLL